MNDIHKRVDQLTEDAFGIVRDVLQDSTSLLDPELNLAICEAALAVMKVKKLSNARSVTSERHVLIRRQLSDQLFQYKVDDETTVFDAMYYATMHWGLDENAGYQIRLECSSFEVLRLNDLLPFNRGNKFVLVES